MVGLLRLEELIKLDLCEELAKVLFNKVVGLNF
jgi:hypothetical protein